MPGSDGRRVITSTARPMDGKLVLVTGATSGIGRAAALELASRGARVVIVARHRGRAEQTRDQIRAATGNERLDLLMGDLSVQADVRRVAREYRERYGRLDVLINNAAGVFHHRQLTADGIEATFALDHLAYFLLTTELLDLLRATAPSRVVNTTSVVASRGRIDFDDLQLARGYSWFRAYSNAKLGNVLFTLELARRVEGSGVTVNCVRPDFVRSGFGAGLAAPMRMVVRLGQVFARPTEAGARTIVYLAASPEVNGVSGRSFFGTRPKPIPPAALDTDLAERLWTVSEQLTAAGASRRVVASPPTH